MVDQPLDTEPAYRLGCRVVDGGAGRDERHAAGACCLDRRGGLDEAVVVVSEVCVPPDTECGIHRRCHLGGDVEPCDEGSRDPRGGTGDLPGPLVDESVDGGVDRLDPCGGPSHAEPGLVHVRARPLPRLLCLRACGASTLVLGMEAVRASVGLADGCIEAIDLGRLLREALAEDEHPRRDLLALDAVALGGRLERPEVAPEVRHDAFRREPDLFRQRPFLVLECPQCRLHALGVRSRDELGVTSLLDRPAQGLTLELEVLASLVRPFGPRLE